MSKWKSRSPRLDCLFSFPSSNVLRSQGGRGQVCDAFPAHKNPTYLAVGLAGLLGCGKMEREKERDHCQNTLAFPPPSESGEGGRYGRSEKCLLSLTAPASAGCQSGHNPLPSPFNPSASSAITHRFLRPRTFWYEHAKVPRPKFLRAFCFSNVSWATCLGSKYKDEKYLKMQREPLFFIERTLVRKLIKLAKLLKMWRNKVNLI